MYYVLTDDECWGEFQTEEAAVEKMNEVAAAFGLDAGSDVWWCADESEWEKGFGDDDDDCDFDFDPEFDFAFDLEEGFNPYMGCYDYDC